MVSHNIGVVLVRIFCIYLAITTIQSLSYVVPSLVEFGQQEGNVQELLASAWLWLMISSILLPAICAVWLWRSADSVIPQAGVDDRASATADEVMLIGVSLLGLYFLISGLVGLVRVEAIFARAAHVDAATWSQRLSILMQILIAVPLLLGRRRLSAWLLKARYMGTAAS